MFHAEVEYEFSYSDFQTEYAQLLALLDSLGVNFNPAIIWNAIPFSFVIDWVVGVSSWLNRLKVGNMDPAINISRYLWSIRRKRRIDCQLGTYDSYGFESRSPLPTLTETAYRRTCKMPARGLFTTSGLNSQELRLGGALLILRKRHIKVKR